MLSSGSASLTVTFLPRMSSTLTSSLVLRRSSWYSLIRPISSRACMPWNSSTSAPSGVVISITLAMAVSGHCRNVHGLRAGDDEAPHRSPGLEAQLGRQDRGLQPRFHQCAPDVAARMTVTTVEIQAMRRVPVDGLFQGEHEQTAGA